MTRDLNLVVVLSVAAQIAAFFKSILIAYFFGVSAELDGYFLAQVVPALVTGTAAGILQSSFLPTYVRLKDGGHVAEASALAGRLAQIIILVGAALAALVALSAPQLVRITAPLADPTVASAAVYSLRVLSLLLLLNALADFLALLLNAELRFATAALAPIANAGIASAFLVMAPELGLANLVWGTLLGLAAQLAILAYGLARARIPLALRGGGNEAREVARLCAAALPAVLIASTAANLPALLAATLGAGAVSAFSYAWKLNQAATQAAGVAIGTVLLPHFAGMLARRDHSSIRAALAHVVPLVFAVAGIALVWIWVAGEPFLRTAFQRGRFSEKDVEYVHRLWLILALGLAPSIASIALAKVIQAASSFAQLAWFGLAGVLVLYAVASVFIEEHDVDGVALGVVASAWIVLGLCALGVSRRVPIASPISWAPGLRPLLLVCMPTIAAMILVCGIPQASDSTILLAASLIAGAGSALLVRSR
jgi:peptidoglycan biosynthesis protein MviN/MurJ (putative lipid II flippase)